MPLVYTSNVGGDPNTVELVTPQQNVARALLQELTTDIVEAPGGVSLTVALVALTASITPTANTGPGYLARYVFVNPADPAVGTTNIDGDVISGAFNFVTAADIPPGDLFELVAWGNGGCGPNGRAQTASGSGGSGTGNSGGGGGERAERWISRADFIAALPVNVFVPLAVEPGAVATVAATNSTPANGQATTIGNLLAAGPGGPGLQTGAFLCGGSGGGQCRAGPIGATTNQFGGGAPVIGLDGSSGQGAGGNLTNARCAIGGGGATGGVVTGTPANINGGRADKGGGGGGAGGNVGVNQTLADSFPGGAGGRSGETITGTSVAAITGGGGPGGAAALPGQPGSNGAPGTHRGSGSGGGGGASSPVVPSVGGRGGDGGAPAGGGGAGGHGRGANGTAWGGQGGRGARGQFTLTAYGTVK